ALEVVGRSLLGSDVPVRVVAGGAAELPLPLRGLLLARQETPAQVHLLDVVDRLVVLVRAGRADVDRPDGLGRQPGAEVVQGAAAVDGSGIAGEGALLAHPRPQLRAEVAGVDDGVIGAGPGILAAGVLDVPPAGAVAALAADGVAVEH